MTMLENRADFRGSHERTRSCITLPLYPKPPCRRKPYNYNSILDPPSLNKRVASSKADLSGIPITPRQKQSQTSPGWVANAMAGEGGVTRDLHNRHLSSQFDSLLPPLQEQVTLLPLAEQVAVCSERPQNSLQSASSSLSQPEPRTEKEDGSAGLAWTWIG